ncbi:MAG TPA: NUDIX domain-containing protein [Bryobacteraceae bacterium]|nr:NUDIX domain-containing protein [Bryobacteraceae bacterium]
MPKRSAGLLLHRRRGEAVEVFLVHPGGPFRARKDAGVWSIPKGEYTDDEEPLAAARRELTEETGLVADGTFLPLGEVRQAGGKVVVAWAAEADFDAATIRSNTFSMEWPPKSGKTREFPEVDRGAWFTIPIARAKILAAQAVFLDRLQAALPVP